jgi:AcrR family transcriptional regulator
MTKKLTGRAVHETPARADRAKSGRAARLHPRDRKQMIVAAATQLFSEQGFTASTAELAQRLGVAQALIYKYFPTKDKLIECVIEDVFPNATFLARNTTLLTDESIAPRQRLVKFYEEWTSGESASAFSRIRMWASLMRPDMTVQYQEGVLKKIFPIIGNILLELCNMSARVEQTAMPQATAARYLHDMMISLFWWRFYALPTAEEEMRTRIEARIEFAVQGLRGTLKRIPIRPSNSGHRIARSRKAKSDS